MGVSCPLDRFVNARKYLVQACGPFQYPPSLISHLVNIAYLLYISFFKSVRSLCHLLCCCIKSLSRPQLMCKLDFIIVQELIIFACLFIDLFIYSERIHQCLKSCYAIVVQECFGAKDESIDPFHTTSSPGGRYCHIWAI